MTGAPKTACLAVLNFNGIKHLEILLPSLVDAARNYPASRIVILDNQSTENDVAWTRQHFPEVQVVVAPENAFLLSYNWLARRITDDLLVVLNNDLLVDKDFLRWMVPHFQQPDVFAVTGCQMDWDGKEPLFGPSTLKRHRGWYWFDFDKSRLEPSYALFASGGFSALDRAKFLELGGYDELFHPGYCEDVDLCFRAWGRGWKSVYEPRSLTRHRNSGSFGEQAQRLNLERMFLFHWRNLRHQPFFSYHCAYLWWTFFRRKQMGDQQWTAAFLTARRLWRQRKHTALRRRPQPGAFAQCRRWSGQPVANQP